MACRLGSLVQKQVRLEKRPTCRLLCRIFFPASPLSWLPFSLPSQRFSIAFFDHLTYSFCDDGGLAVSLFEFHDGSFHVLTPRAFEGTEIEPGLIRRDARQIHERFAFRALRTGLNRRVFKRVFRKSHLSLVCRTGPRADPNTRSLISAARAQVQASSSKARFSSWLMASEEPRMASSANCRNTFAFDMAASCLSAASSAARYLRACDRCILQSG